MRILLSNDDGIRSPCLRALWRALTGAGHIVDVVAPLVEQSGVGCGVSLHHPLRLHPVHEDDFSGTAVAGTPVDCVKIALTVLLPEAPDLVVSGINNGSNKGVDVYYSGTVGAATEAALRGLPAVAFSRPRPGRAGPARRRDRGRRGLAVLCRDGAQRQLPPPPRGRVQGHPGGAHGHARVGRKL